jgi:hypothetical protein
LRAGGAHEFDDLAFRTADIEAADDDGESQWAARCPVYIRILG